MSDELKQIEVFAEEAKGKQITSQAELEDAAVVLKEIKGRQKRVMDIFGPLKDKTHKAWKAVCDEESNYLNPLKQAESFLKSKMGAYNMEQERLRQEEERRLQEEARKKEEARLKEQAKKTGDKSILEKPIIVPEIKIQPQEQPKGTSFVEKWNFKIVDADKVPKEFLVVDEKAIASIVRVKKGNTNIPGVEVYMTKEVRQRA
jgi:hypothetical protein